MDFSGKINDVTYLSTADPGWRVTWFVSPGERLGISVFPPRPYPWAESFDRTFTLTHRSVPIDAYEKVGEHIDALIMWDFFQRSWAMSWGREWSAVDDEALRSHIAAIKQAGMRPIPYMTGWFYYSLDAEEFTGEVKRLRDAYGFEGVYYDGIPLDWVVAYEEMRMTREIFPDGRVILHHTYPAPLYEGSIELPAIASYADVTWMAELIYGVGRDWPYPKYFTSQYRKANCVGVMLHDHWEWGSRVDKDIMMLHHNGRASAPSLPWKTGPNEGVFGEWVERYIAVAEELRKLWQEKGDDPDFYEKHYLPKVRELTDDQLPD
jgi:DNA-binding transcriptional ArsR family regulator